MEPIIKVENIGKMYLIGHLQQSSRRYVALRDVITGKIIDIAKYVTSSSFRKARAQTNRFSAKEEFWALRDISFEVNKGDRVGIIGRNGAGKSTLLKILSKITEPSGGRIAIHGRIASLLEVGTGFHPELTGRENVFLNGAVLGMRRTEIKSKFDEIVAFAEVEKFLDTPVKHYSSGMYVRLAFAVAAHLEPEILVVDEVLAVGDAQFQKKCLGKMEDVTKNEGRTVLFVSHNMAAVQQLCTKGIVLDHGQISFSGIASEAIDRYINSADLKFEYGEDGFVNLENARNKLYLGKVFKKIRILDETNLPCQNFPMLSPMKIEIEMQDTESFPNADYAVYINTPAGLRVTTFYPRWMQPDFENEAPKTILLDIPLVNYSPGTYRIGLSSAFFSAGQFIDLVEDAITFNIEQIDSSGTGKAFPAGYGVVIPQGKFIFK